MLLLLIAILGSPRQDTTEHVDLIERNHVHREDGTLQFTQIIYWRFTKEDMEVAHFRVVKDDQPDSFVQRSQGKFMNVFIWEGKARTCYAKFYRESWTAYDPEQLNKLKCRPENRTWKFRHAP